MKKNNLILGFIDNSHSEARRPATCSRNPEILLYAQDLTGSSEQVAGRRNLNCQQTLKFIIFICCTILYNNAFTETVIKNKLLAQNRVNNQNETLTHDESINTSIPTNQANSSVRHKVITLSLGPAWSNPGQTQTIYFSPSFPQSYQAKSHVSEFGDGEVFLGIQQPINSSIFSQLGLALAATTNMQLKGEIWQDNDPNFNNFSYNYKISHAHIALRGKVFKNLSDLLQPYISASLGVGFNHAYNYTNTPTLFEITPEPPFKHNTTTAFTYTLDIGIQRKFDNHWSLGVGYEFADWGKTTLDRALNQEFGSGLNLHHVYTNELQFSLSFVA